MHKTTLELAGIGLSRFKPHSIRSASASAAAGSCWHYSSNGRLVRTLHFCKVYVLQEANSTMQQRELAKVLAPVVQTLDSAIHRINRYPVDKYTPLFILRPEVAWKRGLRAIFRANLKNHGGKHRDFAWKTWNVFWCKPYTRRHSMFIREKWEDISKWTIPQLKFWLKCRRLNQQGLKKDLVEK